MNLPASPDSRPSFAGRPASSNWEQLAIPWLPGGLLWVWYKPGHAPQGVVVRVPDEVWPLAMGKLTLRHVLEILALNASEVRSWTVQGMTLDAALGANPLLDQPLPPPVPWADSSIMIHCGENTVPAGFPPTMQPQWHVPQQAAPTGSDVPMNADSEQLLAAMDADWNAIQQLETQLGQLRKQLSTIQGRLQSLNRDLSTDERQAADSNDVKNWQDARRFLRDASGNVSRYIREHDIGLTSAAGQRNRFEDIYKTHVKTRQSFEGLAAAQHEFETYRKLVQSLLGKMQTALSNAGSNGEQRAQQVLNRIAAKIRKAKNR